MALTIHFIVKITKPVLTGFASIWIIAAYLIHPILSIFALIIFVAILTR